MGLSSLHRVTVFPSIFPGHLIQAPPYEGYYQTHGPLWFQYLGTQFTIVRLDHDGESLVLASPTYHLLLTHSSTTHYSNKIWGPPISP